MKASAKYAREGLVGGVVASRKNDALVRLARKVPPSTGKIGTGVAVAVLPVGESKLVYVTDEGGEPLTLLTAAQARELADHLVEAASLCGK
jgi:hypothetical protein